ncbi:MAG: 3-oxoacyl-ACP reductase [Rhodospirillaceae bacterium]|nr:3-oxoacyl-ACP reductase [Rhodospirillaceae bacterium]|tara:strand:+ start:2142 stop:2933 length:792 start_codon:yes stop_codon:yes gene_type:complete
MDTGLEGKRGLIMGASAGMGNGIARSLAAEGVNLILTSRRNNILKAEAKYISEKYGNSVETFACDFSKDADIERLLDFVENQYGGVDIQFNNCGGPPRLLPSETSDQIWREWFDIIVLAAIRITSLSLPHMKQKKWGRVISMTSSNIYIAATTNVLSTSLRMALVGWSKALANEVAGDGITVNCLVPGRISTDRLLEGDTSRASRAGVTPEQMRLKLVSQSPLGRDGSVEEMANLATFLCSKQASYVTGSVIRADGGSIPVTL